MYHILSQCHWHKHCLNIRTVCLNVFFEKWRGYWEKYLRRNYTREKNAKVGKMFFRINGLSVCSYSVWLSIGSFVVGAVAFFHFLEIIFICVRRSYRKCTEWYFMLFIFFILCWSNYGIAAWFRAYGRTYAPLCISFEQYSVFFLFLFFHNEHGLLNHIFSFFLFFFSILWFRTSSFGYELT